MASLVRERANSARLQVHQNFNGKRQAFLDFVLSRHEKEGVQEIKQDNLSPLLRLKYSSIGDAVTDLGEPDEIRELFVGFQKCLYEARLYPQVSDYQCFNYYVPQQLGPRFNN